jgi:hypothetical protein
MTVTSVVIVGAGAAGTAAATQLRTLGFDGDLSLVHGERLVPYNRTTVNKTLLQPDARLESVRTVLPDDVRTVLLTGRAQRLDIPRRAVVLQDGSRLSYDGAIIATGARPRLLPAREGSLDGPWLSGPVTPLRTSDDAEHIRRLLADVGRRHERPARVGIVGASLLGSETADVLTTLGHEVFLIGAAADPLGPSVGHHHRAVDPDAARGAPRRPHRGPRRLAGGSRRRPQACPGQRLRDSRLALDDGVLLDDRLRAVSRGCTPLGTSLVSRGLRGSSTGACVGAGSPRRPHHQPRPSTDRGPRAVPSQRFLLDVVVRQGHQRPRLAMPPT